MRTTSIDHCVYRGVERTTLAELHRVLTLAFRLHADAKTSIENTRLALALIVGGAAWLAACANAYEAPSAVPSDPPVQSAPLVVVPGLEEGLVKTKPTNDDEDQALAAAADAFKTLGVTPRDDREVFTPFEAFVEAHPESGWTPAVLTNLGLAYYRRGYFSRAIDAYTAAWQKGRGATDPAAKALVDRAVGELARMHARVGHADELEALFREIGDRPIVGSATEALTGAREGAWQMRNEPGDAFLCGPKALANTLRVLGKPAKSIALADAAKSGRRGFSLEQVAQLAESAQLPHRVIYRAPGQSIPVPSVINWKVKHYAAIVAEEDGYYHIKDPTFGGDLTVSRAAIDAEGSGYFLVPRGGRADPFWRDASLPERTAIYGMGYTASSQEGATTPGDTKVGNGCSPNSGGHGMCVPDAHAMLVSLNLNDTPVGYAPQKGPPVFVQLTYNQREAFQPANPPHFNVGPKWTLNFLSYVMDSPSIPSSTSVTRPVEGGGYITYSTYEHTTGTWQRERQTGAVLSRTPFTGVATSYTLTKTDGSQLIYASAEPATSGARRVFLTAIVDPQGNRLTLAYDSIWRLTTITDAAGRRTTFSYALGGYLVTAITDPFGRSASLSYFSNGSLQRITDVIGITSEFTYNPTQDPTLTTPQLTLTTPYGTNRFFFGSGVENQRYLVMEDPTGRRERLEFIHKAPGVPATDPAATVPANVGAFFYTNDFQQYRNSFYWDKDVYQPGVVSQNYLNAKRWHWLHTAANQTSPLVESTKERLESRVWYNYDGQFTNGSATKEGSSGDVTAIARVRDDGVTEIARAFYNQLGKPLEVTDPRGRRTRYTYAVNKIDLQRIERQTSSSSFSTLESYTYNSQHLPLTKTDAAGMLWKYTYNAAGQLATETDPLNRVTTYNYDAFGRLTTVVNANNKTIRTNTYPPACETSNPSRLNCELPRSTTDSEGRLVSFTRDALDRLREVIYPDGTKDVLVYNKLDISDRTDRMQRTTHYDYHPGTRLVSAVTNPLQHRTEHTYFPSGRQKTLKDEKGNVTTWGYDGQGRLSSKTFADGKTIAYAYEGATSRVRTITDPLNRVKTFTYDLEGLLSSIDYSGAPAKRLTFTPDSFFRRYRRIARADGRSVDWVYISPGLKGALKPATEIIDGSTSTAVAYDEFSRVVSRTVTGDLSAETWHYDTIGRVDQHVTGIGTFNYTFLGQTSAPTNRSLAGTTISTTWGYDTNANDRRLQGFSAGNGARSLSFGHERNGQAGTNPYQVTSMISIGGPAGGETSCFNYDGDGRLISKGFPTGLRQGSCSLPQTTLFNYGYDPADNLTTFKGADGAVISPTYNSLNQIVSGRPGSSYIFDAVGNLVSDGTDQYVWDEENRLIEIRNGGVSVAKFRYDVLGRRSHEEQYSGGALDVTTTFRWCGDTLCGKQRTFHQNPVAPSTHRFYPEGQVNTNAGTSGGKWVATRDHLGNVVDAINATTGVVEGRREYTPYGQDLFTDRKIDLAYGGLFLGARNLLYSTTRVYDPTIGRWLSRDTIGETGGINLYAYVGGDPINRSDPWGLWEAGAGITLEFDVIAPFVSGGGGAIGLNLQFNSDSGLGLYAYRPSDDPKNGSQGLSCGGSATVNIAWGDGGDWTGNFYNLGGGAGPWAGGIFQSDPGPGPGTAWQGVSLGYGAGLPFGLGANTTNYVRIF